MNSFHPAPISKVVKSADGTAIYADCAGNPSNPAIVFIHGFALSAVVWDAIFSDQRWLNSVYMIRYDMRGHGRSGKPDDKASWESKRRSEDFDAVIQGFKLKKPFIAGWSIGATVITDVLSFHPPCYISGIIHITPIPYIGPIFATLVTPEMHPVLVTLTQPDRDARRAAADAFVTLCSTTLSPAQHQIYANVVLSQPHTVTARLLSMSQDMDSLMNVGRQSDFPVIMINATRDRALCPAESVRAMQGWRNLKIVDLDTEHFPWLDEPGIFRQEVLEWVAKVVENSV